MLPFFPLNTFSPPVPACLPPHTHHIAPLQEEGEELCNCEFSLAYGAKILLNNATMRLIRGRRYGLCGPNGVGKSTLMRAIANGQVDGFPPADELRTVYVEHDIQASMADLNVVDFVFADPLLHSSGLDVSREEIVTQLSSVGFTQDMLAMVITSLSGGWKMKLALARAMLMKVRGSGSGSGNQSSSGDTNTPAGQRGCGMLAEYAGQLVYS